MTESPAEESEQDVCESDAEHSSTMEYVGLYANVATFLGDPDKRRITLIKPGSSLPTISMLVSGLLAGVCLSPPYLCSVRLQNAKLPRGFQFQESEGRQVAKTTLNKFSMAEVSADLSDPALSESLPKPLDNPQLEGLTTSEIDFAVNRLFAEYASDIDIQLGSKLVRCWTPRTSSIDGEPNLLESPGFDVIAKDFAIDLLKVPEPL